MFLLRLGVRLRRRMLLRPRLLSLHRRTALLNGFIALSRFRPLRRLGALRGFRALRGLGPLRRLGVLRGCRALRGLGPLSRLGPLLRRFSALRGLRALSRLGPLCRLGALCGLLARRFMLLGRGGIPGRRACRVGPWLIGMRRDVIAAVVGPPRGIRRAPRTDHARP